MLDEDADADADADADVDVCAVTQVVVLRWNSRSDKAIIVIPTMAKTGPKIKVIKSLTRGILPTHIEYKRPISISMNASPRLPN